MIKGIGVCESCPNSSGCHPALKPERFKHCVTGRKVVPLHGDSHYPCRHFSCSQGLWAAAGAQLYMQRNGGDTYTVTELDGISHSIEAKEFHTGDKMTIGEYARIVSTEGRVYSKQDDVFYPTGQ